MLSAMRSSRLPTATLLLPLLLAAGPAGAYRVVTSEGEKLEASALARVGEVFRLGTEDGTVELPAGSIDFYSTFRANTEEGNIVAFAAGGFLRFESVSFARGRVTFELGEERSITVSESIVDFRTSVLEGSSVVMPASALGGVSVAKATENPRPNRGTKRPGRRRPERKVSKPGSSQTERSR
jgi:hypothetical protein